jgi:two-component system response regulator AtoC
MRSEANRPRLLLVENDRATYMALKAIFTLRGWDVTVATTLAQAKSAVDEQMDLQAVILDLMLPDGHGEDLLAQLQAMPEKVPVAVTTGVDDSQRIAEVEKLAPTILLRKPIALAELIGAISPKAA